MSSKSYVFPYDHQTSSSVVEGVDPASLWSLTPQGDKPPKVGTTRVFYNTPKDATTVVSSLGGDFAKKSANAKRELVRKSVATAVKDLKGYDGVKEVQVEASIDPHASGEFFRGLVGLG